MRKLNEYQGVNGTSTVWYSPAKQEYYVELNGSGHLDYKRLNLERAMQAAQAYVDEDQPVVAVLKPRSSQ